MDTLSTFTIPGIVYLLTLAFGVWLSHSGKPYPGLLFNIHKLISLGWVILTVVQLSRMLKNGGAQALLILALGLAGLCVVALFASGALMSMGKLNYTLTLTIHRITPAVLFIAILLAVTLLAPGSGGT